MEDTKEEVHEQEEKTEVTKEVTKLTEPDVNAVLQHEESSIHVPSELLTE